MDTGSDLDRVIRRSTQIVIHTCGASKLGIILICYTLVPIRKCFGKCCRIHIDLRCEVLDRIPLNRDAGRNILLSCLEAFAQLLIKDNVRITAGLRQFCRRNLIAGKKLISKALAILIDKDRAVAADTLCDQHAGLLLYSRMKLDLVDIDEICAYCLSHNNTVAHDSGCTGSNRSLKVVAVSDDHFLIIAEAAGSKDHCL